MKFKIAVVEFEKKCEVSVIFPPDFTTAQIEQAAEEEVDNLDHYDTYWESSVISVKEIDVPAEDCRTEQRGRIHNAVHPVFQRCLVRDPVGGFVDALDTDWWIVAPEQLEEIKRQERLRQDIHHPDQLALPLYGDME
jgi:hypothetical protein